MPAGELLNPDPSSFDPVLADGGIDWDYRLAIERQQKAAKYQCKAQSLEIRMENLSPQQAESEPLNIALHGYYSWRARHLQKAAGHWIDLNGEHLAEEARAYLDVIPESRPNNNRNMIEDYGTSKQTESEFKGHGLPIILESERLTGEALSHQDQANKYEARLANRRRRSGALSFIGIGAFAGSLVETAANVLDRHKMNKHAKQAQQAGVLATAFVTLVAKSEAFLRSDQGKV